MHRRTMCVDEGLIPSRLTNVDVNPPLAVITPDFCPDVVFAVPYPPYPAADGATEHAEAVGPFTNSSSPRLEQHEGVVVAWEALIGPAMLVRALVKLDSVCTARLFVRKRGGHSHCDCRGAAGVARRVVDPLEEALFEPTHQRSDDAVLISPRRLGVSASRVRNGGGLCLENVRFFLRLVVNLFQWYSFERFVQKTWVLPSAGSVGEGMQHCTEPHRLPVARSCWNEGYIAEGGVGWRRW